MSTATVKLDLVKKLLSTDDKNIINQIKAIFDTQSDDWWGELPDEIKKSVEKGLKQSEKGQTIPHDEVMKKYSKWLKK